MAKSSFRLRFLRFRFGFFNRKIEITNLDPTHLANFRQGVTVDTQAAGANLSAAGSALAKQGTNGGAGAKQAAAGCVPANQGQHQGWS